MSSAMASFKQLGLTSLNPPMRSTGTSFTRSVACCTTRSIKTISKFAMRSARHTVVCGAVDQKETEVKTEVTELTVSNPETIKTTEMNFELELERSLFNTRYLAFIGVVGSLAGTTLMMCNGVIVMGSAIMMQTNSVMSGGHAEVGGYVVAAIDDFVLGVVLLVFGLGMYELFISEIDQEAMGNGTDLSLGKRPEWLQTKGLDDLKKKLAKVIIMSLLVKTLGFFESVEVSGSTELLQAATAVTLCSIAMYFAGLGKQDPITK